MLAIYIFSILFFILYAGPFLEPYLGLKPVAEEIERRNIKANMYFYSEVEQFYEAQLIMTNSRNYPVDSNDSD
ncbi:MAG: hypothetical protein JXL81_13350 [Deltaproteobacteria bacterium]|nr:hypothetical protein [Deltaproteobacteria bacterium]